MLWSRLLTYAAGRGDLEKPPATTLKHTEGGSNQIAQHHATAQGIAHTRAFIVEPPKRIAYHVAIAQQSFLRTLLEERLRDPDRIICNTSSTLVFQFAVETTLKRMPLVLIEIAELLRDCSQHWWISRRMLGDLSRPEPMIAEKRELVKKCRYSI